MDSRLIYVLAFLLFPLVDSVYLTTIASKMYGTAIEKIQGSPMTIRFTYVIASYMFLMFGMYYFLLRDINVNAKWWPQILRAFLFGIVVYGVYETTNAAILNKWTLDLVVIDTLWGGILYATVIGIVLMVLKKGY